MRYFQVSLVAFLGLAGVVAAQQATPDLPTRLDPNNRLDYLLLQWEEKMTQVQSLEARVSREKEDKVFRTSEVYEGKAKYLKPNLAMLDLSLHGNPAVMEKYVCTGTFLYEYQQASKELRVHELPPPKPGQVSQDNFLSFLFGMKAIEAKRRYDLKLVGEDKYYVYIEVTPRFPADRAEFNSAKLALTKQTFLPRLLMFTEPNGNTIKWNIPEIQSGVSINRNEFEKPSVPPGWRVVKAPPVNQGMQFPSNQGAPPRVVRPKQP